MNKKSQLSLLSHCSSGGCGAKIASGALSLFLADIHVKKDPGLLVGFEHRDDAAIYKINEKQALVSTVDFFPPMVDDPFLFGKIAVANALSDIYAMGAKPLVALNLLCFPEKGKFSFLKDILAGGAEKILEADAVLAGGHSIYDHEPKYGLAVTGIINPKAVIKNNTCKTGDVLILTKALGVGIIMAASREKEASKKAYNAAVASMERLNRYAAEKMLQMCTGAGNRGSRQHLAIHACTDVTGFGLAVHASEMAGESHTLIIDTASLPLLPDVINLAENGYSTSGGKRNYKFMRGKCDIRRLSQAMRELIFDPQTSGGLLIAVAPEAAAELCAAIQAGDPTAAIIGKVVKRKKHPVEFI